MLRRETKTTTLVLALLFGAGTAMADGGVVFTDIAENGGAGITYERVPSPRKALQDAIFALSPYTFTEAATHRLFNPQKARGAPGVAILDYDNDGDLDLYVTNGPGADNSLYSNQLEETGELTFVDVGASSGAGAFDQDSAGVCFGDIDNDGDSDIYVTATGDLNRLFENQGDGTFADITASAGVAGDGRHATGCSFADVDNDGLLDIFVANTYDSWNHMIPVFLPGATYPLFEHNYLFRNLGGNQFEDVSAAAGLEEVSGLDLPGLSGAGFTWCHASVDYDLDGDIDFFAGDNQGIGPSNPSEERGSIRLYQNGGTGSFTEVTAQAGLQIREGWMGFDFGDLNCDGHMDFFVSSGGYYLAGADHSSRWFFGGPDGSFTSPGVGDLIITPFGWGNSIFDYDNDGDGDIIFHGGDDVFLVALADNPGILLQNTGECSGIFDWDQAAVPKDHRFRGVQGVATGDLDRDGFGDIVTVSHFDVVPGFVVPAVPIFFPPSGSIFDEFALFEFQVSPFHAPPNWVALETNWPNGSLAIEMNSGNGNHWVELDVEGSVGVLADGKVNRDGIGAVVFFTPDGGKTSMRPILGGASYASQSSLAASFGLGDGEKGTVEVLWPGGVRNRLYGVHRGERVTLPEIPCSFAGEWDSFQQYHDCVETALDGLIAAGTLSPGDQGPFLSSALVAFQEEHP